MDLQHNRAMLHNFDNKFDFAYLVDSPLFSNMRLWERLHSMLSWLSSLSRLLSDFTFWEIPFAQLLQFHHWYIIILWFHCIIIFIEVSHPHCFPYVSTYFVLLLFDLSLRTSACTQSSQCQISSRLSDDMSWLISCSAWPGLLIHSFISICSLISFYFVSFILNLQGIIPSKG